MAEAARIVRQRRSSTIAHPWLPRLTLMSSLVVKLIATPLRPNLEAQDVSNGAWQGKRTLERVFQPHLPDRPMRWM